MSLPRFLAPGPFEAGSSVTLAGEEGRHAAVVRRIRVGKRLVLTDGAGAAATCEVSGAEGHQLVLRVESVAHTPPPCPRISVIQAIAKGDRAERAVEMLTEIGADEIVAWQASRSVALWRGERATKSLARWQSTAREASKQARRSWLPQVTGPVSTGEVTGRLAQAGLGVVLHEAASAPLSALPVGRAESIVVVVGPEGGITDEELAAFAAAHVVRLGDSVLRTSTAGVAAVSAILSHTPRWS